MKKSFFGLIIVFVFIACGGNSSEERKNGFTETAKNPEDSLFQEVMDGHDAAMAKMNKLTGYRKQVDQRLDSLKKVKSPAKKTLVSNYIRLNEKLKTAEDDMNKWMDAFIIDSAQDDTKRRIEYLQSEKIKVDMVKQQVLNAVASADSVLNK
jgi:hypothetical protein